MCTRCLEEPERPCCATVDEWLDRFALDPFVRGHVCHVVTALPDEVRHDLMGDPRFGLCDYEPGTGRAFSVPMGLPGMGGSRSVVLKRTLRHRPTAFVRWVIAHELAHAYLRNDGRHPEEDPEHAADALAAEWGFPKPAVMPW